MVSTLVLALVAVVGLCSGAPNFMISGSNSVIEDNDSVILDDDAVILDDDTMISDVDNVIVNHEIDVHAQIDSAAARVGGNKAITIQEYPWIVQMEFFSGVWTQACTGSILNTLYVLSAAQCTHSYTDPLFRPENRRIRAGATNTNTGGSLRHFYSVLNHPAYTPSRDNDADISLIRLNVPLTLQTTIQSIIIAPQNFFLPDNVILTYAGWEENSTGGSNSKVLVQGTVNSINFEVCKQRYASANPPRTVTNNMICSVGKDSCQGNAGGPLVYNRTLIAIVSTISSGPYCNSSYPGVNTKVASYTNWIVNNVW